MSRRRETRRSCLSFQAMLAASLCAQVKSCRARCGKTTRRANQQNPSSVRCENIPLSPSGKSVILIGASHPMRGACARHGRAARCGGRGAGAGRAQAARVRRSRVVLTPRCWRQLGGKCPAGDGGKRGVHRGEHEVSRKATAHEKYRRKNPLEINAVRQLCRHLCRDPLQRLIAVQKYIHLLGCNQS